MLGAHQIYFIPWGTLYASVTLIFLGPTTVPLHMLFLLPRICTCLSFLCYLPRPLTLSLCGTSSGKPSVAPHSLGIVYPSLSSHCIASWVRKCKEDYINPWPSRASCVFRQKLLLPLPLEEGSLLTWAGDTLELSTEPWVWG